MKLESRFLEDSDYDSFFWSLYLETQRRQDRGSFSFTDFICYASMELEDTKKKWLKKEEI